MRIAQVHVFGELHIKKAGIPHCIKFFTAISEININDCTKPQMCHPIQQFMQHYATPYCGLGALYAVLRNLKFSTLLTYFLNNRTNINILWIWWRHRHGVIRNWSFFVFCL